MIFAEVNWLNISIDLLLVGFVIVCLLMSLLILMQRPKQEGLGAAFGGGVTDQVFGARTTNVLQKGTVYLGSLFFLMSITLAILIGKQSKQKSLLEPEKVTAAVVEKKIEPPVVEEPKKEKSIADELNSEEAPAVTEEPSATQEATTSEAPVAPSEEAPATPVKNNANKSE